MPAGFRKSWNTHHNNKDQPKRRQIRGDTLATLVDKQVIVITRSGHWFHGVLRDVDGRGILITTVMRIEPKISEDGNHIRDTQRMITLKRALPFEIPVDGLGEIVVRKMFIAWGNVAQILRAKTKEEIEMEDPDKNI